MTREGSLRFFSQFLAAGERWAEWVKSIPLTFHINNTSPPRDVIGTLLLSVLNGLQRYADINAGRGTSGEPHRGFATAATSGHYRADAEPEHSGDSQPLAFRTARMTSSTKPKTNGDGVVIRRRKSPPAASWPSSSP